MRGSSVLAVCIVLAGATAALAQTADAVAQQATDDQIALLIEQLGDRQFAVRQRAQQQLMKLGFDAFDALVEAENHEDPEVAMQAGYLVRQIRSGWTQESDPRPIQEILKNYELQNDDERLAKIKELAALPDDGGLKWLCRLVRFEKSPQLSKQAALAIMAHAPADEAAWTRRAETIHAELKRTRRRAAQWLEVYLEAHADPAGALPKWSALAAAEQQTLGEHPRDTHSQIVIDLLRREVEMLDLLERRDATEPVMRQMVLAERGDSASLAELINWLVKRRAWSMVDLVAERFSASFEVDALLMYTLCEARAAEGKDELVEEIAARALQIHGDSQQEHVLLADRLGSQGLPRWADRELRYAIELGPAGTQWDVLARKLLANSFHDRQEDRQAGELLKQLVDAAETDSTVMQRLRTSQQQQFEVGLNSLRSDMYFYQACHAAAEGNAKEQRSLLEKSLELNQQNIEALIALYQVTDAGDPKREDLTEWSKAFIEDCRDQIEDQPENPTYYNQIAWLVANTEGDVDEAIELSQRSIELARVQDDSPLRLGGLLDTLSHCYFAAGDYAKAIKTQEEAARLDPHTHSIRRAGKVSPGTGRKAGQEVVEAVSKPSLGAAAGLSSSANLLDNTAGQASSGTPRPSLQGCGRSVATGREPAVFHADDHQHASGPTRRVRAGAVELEVLDRGAELPIVFLHGFPLDHSMWDAQVAELSAHDRAIAPDLRGFGGSQVVPGTATMAQMADDMAALLDALAVNQPVVLCGLSMGGYVAFEFWRKYADRLRALVLCDTRAMADTPEAVRARHETAERVLAEGTGPLADGMLPKLFAPATLDGQANLTAIQRQVILATSREGAAAALRGMAARKDFREALPRIALPVLVVVGEHDAISTENEMRSMAEAMPEAELVVIAGAGHMSPLENAPAVNAAIERFVQRVEATS